MWKGVVCLIAASIVANGSDQDVESILDDATTESRKTSLESIILYDDSATSRETLLRPSRSPCDTRMLPKAVCGIALTATVATVLYLFWNSF